MVASATHAADSGPQQPSPAPVPEHIPWHEPSPLARLFLQLPFDAPQTTAAGRLAVQLDVLYSNSILLADGGSDPSLLVHVETAQPTLLLKYGLARNIEAQLAIPSIVDYGGFLDGVIWTVESWFNRPNPQRRQILANTPRYVVTRADGSGILSDVAAAGLGDVWAGLKVGIPVPLAGVDLALRGAVKFPTGRVPFGSEELDVGAGLLASWSWRGTALRLEVDVVAPTAKLPVVHIDTRPYGAIQFAAVQRLGNRVAILAQASGHSSPLTGTGLVQLDAPTAYVLVGVNVAVARSIRLRAAVAENIFSSYRGADITFPIGIEGRF